MQTPLKKIFKIIAVLSLVSAISSLITIKIIHYKQKNAEKINAISPQEIEKLKQALSKNLSIHNINEASINPTPIKNIFEVNVEKQILYTTPDAHYIFIGNLLDIQNKINLTQEKTEKIQTIKWENLPLNNAIKWEKGNIKDTIHQKKQIAIFADPNCTYCHKMEQELQQIENITVYTFIVPMLSEDSLQKGNDIWCNSNPLQTWKDWMLKNITPPKVDKACSNPLQDNAKLAQSIGITGTPTIFFMDGSRVSGIMNVNELNKKLNLIK